jgi:hypothetical protein
MEIITDDRKRFLDDVPLAEYTFDTSQPDRLETQICREQDGREQQRE